jgi:hypothetical protein
MRVEGTRRSETVESCDDPYLSAITVLQPGGVIATGTQPGDIVKVAISHF